MLSHQRLQNALSEMKDITNREFALFSKNGSCIGYTNHVLAEQSEAVLVFRNEDKTEKQMKNGLFLQILIDDEPEYILLMSGMEADSEMIGRMAACQIRNLIASMEEQFDRNMFIQNVLLGNLLTVDIYSKARKLHIEALPRVVFVIDTGEKENEVVIELVRNLSDMKTGDFVTSVDEHSVVLVKDMSSVPEEQLENRMGEIAVRLVDNIHMEAMIKVRVGYGNVAEQIQEIARSFQEARMALQVGGVFYADRDTLSYGKLGIGRLIYQLPMSLCEMYIREVFGEQIPQILEDEEAMSTIAKFFENNLNISETARQLFVHRNTLVYRLERIEKAIGLDIRKFDDAMTFRIAVMVLAHMKESTK